MKKIIFALILLFFSYSAIAGTICTQSGNIKQITSSSGNAGVEIDTSIGSCACLYNVGWIDLKSEGGKAMYSTALAAKIANKPITVTVEDGLGQGAQNNLSITYRLWATCEIKALDIK